MDSAIGTFLVGFPELTRVLAHIFLNYYMPVFQPIRWWRHIRAVHQLLEEIGWYDSNIDL
jgi:hypothetical protein